MNLIVTYGEDSIYHRREGEFHGNEELESDERFAPVSNNVKRAFIGFDPRLYGPLSVIARNDSYSVLNVWPRSGVQTDWFGDDPISGVNSIFVVAL